MCRIGAQDLNSANAFRCGEFCLLQKNGHLLLCAATFSYQAMQCIVGNLTIESAILDYDGKYKEIGNNFLCKIIASEGHNYCHPIAKIFTRLPAK